MQNDFDYGYDFGKSYGISILVEDEKYSEIAYLIYAYTYGRTYYMYSDIEYKWDFSKWSKATKNNNNFDENKLNGFEIGKKIYDILLKEIKEGKLYFQGKKVSRVIEQYLITAEVVKNGCQIFDDEYWELFKQYEKDIKNDPTIEVIDEPIEPEEYDYPEEDDFETEEEYYKSVEWWEPTRFNISIENEYIFKEKKFNKRYDFSGFFGFEDYEEFIPFNPKDGILE